MKTSKSYLAGALLLGSLTTGCPQPEPPSPLGFAPEAKFAAGTGADAVALADFNGDKKPDIAVANSGDATISILLGKGDASFQSAVSYGVGNVPSSIAVGDFNGDSKADLVVANKGDGTISILLGKGDGTFHTQVTYLAGRSPTALVLGDFNGDSIADLVVADSADGKIGVLLGMGDGTFRAEVAYDVSPTPLGITAGDFNGDKKLDLAVADSSGISMLLGNGDGTFMPASHMNTGAGAISVAAGDLNDDSKPDLAVALAAPDANGSLEILLLGNGDGTFQTPVELGNIAACCLAIIDLNDDGHQDIAAVGRHAATGLAALAVRLGKGTGTFSPAQVYFADEGPASLAIGDLNGDKYADVVITHTGSGAATVLANTTGLNGGDPEVHMFANPSPAFVAQDLTYTLFISNRGPNLVTAALSDKLPSAVLVDEDGGCQGTSVLNCTIRIQPGFVSQITVIVTPTAAGSLTNSAVVTSTSDLDTNNDAAAVSTTVNPATRPTLQVSLSGSGAGAVNSNPVGISCAPRCLTSYSSGTPVSLAASPDEKSFFTGWNGACSNEAGDCSLSMTGNKSVTADFVAGQTLSVGVAGTGSGMVTSSSGGISCGGAQGPCSALFMTNTVVSLTAVPASDSHFDGWSGACNGTNPKSCTVKTSTDISVTASFTLMDFQIHVDAPNLTVKRGGQTSDLLNFPAQGAFSGNIALTCSVAGPAPMPTCGIAPASVNAGGSATLTMDARALAAVFRQPSRFEAGYGLFATWLPLGLLGCVLATSLDKKWRRLWAPSLLILVVTILPAACGSSNSIKSPPPQQQHYTVTVTGTSGVVQHSTVISVTVQ